MSSKKVTDFQWLGEGDGLIQWLMGNICEAFGKHLEASGKHLDASVKHLKASGKPYWSPSEASGKHLGALSGAYGDP